MVQRWHIWGEEGLGAAIARAASARGAEWVEAAEADRLVIPLPTRSEGSFEELSAALVTAPLAWLQGLRPPRGAKVAVLTHRLGSLGLTVAGDRPALRAALAARNMAFLAWARSVAEDGVALTLVAVEAQAAPEALADGVLARLDELNMASSGSLWSWDGRQLPW
ncbi:hypothetical protein L6R49_21790 [Myxococcota bacterium]|nr:hypothetical protein [Myxococcota bacterium]